MSDKIDKIHIKIGLKIKFERMKKNLSQEQLALLADLSKTHIGDIERGESVPSIEVLNKIAVGLDITLPELVDVSKVDL